MSKSRLQSIINFLSLKVKHSKISNSLLKFQKLTPVDDVDLNVYENSLNFIFENTDLTNIAISGSFGSGKSSVIKSYEQKHKKLRFLYLSLAPFENVKSKEDNDNDMSLDAIERKILNSLIHVVNSRKVKKTVNRHRNKVNCWQIFFHSLEILILILFIFFVIFNDNWVNLYNGIIDVRMENVLRITIVNEFKILYGIISSIILCHLFFMLLKTQSVGELIEKISFQGTEIKLFQGKDDMVFEKYLNEILYILEEANVNAIIFEDFERFKDNRVFTRLREINNLVNYRNKKIIKFLYLINDELFNSKDRTKFFDFIMPIVPVVDSSNSYDKLIEYIHDIENINLDKTFLKNISFYIDDMRVLKNILNEFIIYLNLICDIELDINKLFAIITYKNIFPFDFSNLQLGKGYVHFILNSRKEIIDINKESIQGEIDELNTEEHLLKVQIEKATDEKNYSIKNKLMKTQELIRELTIKLNNLGELKLYQLINGDNFIQIFNLEFIETKRDEFKLTIQDFYFPLLRFLIRRGYIDETYTDYISKFYEGRLSTNDKRFLSSIHNKRAKMPSYDINDPKEILEYLNEPDFDQPEVLNNHLTSYILENGNIYEKYIARLIIQLKNENNFGFIFQYLENITEHNDFIKKMNSLWPNIFDVMMDTANINNYSKQNYLIESFYSSTRSDIVEMNKKDNIKKYIEKNTEIFISSDLDTIKITDCLKAIGFKYAIVSEYLMNDAMLKSVYDNSLYELNKENIAFFIKKNFDGYNEVEIFRRSYSILLSKPNEPLTEFVNNNIETYIIECLKVEGVKFNEDSDVLKKILNNDNVSVELKKKYLILNETIIEDLVDIVDFDLWKNIVFAGTLRFTANNLMEYLMITKELDDGEEISEELIEFIENHDGDLEFNYNEFGDKYETSRRTKFLIKILICNSISDERYKKIVKNLNVSFRSLNITELEDNKIDILIQEKTLKMTKSNYNNVKSINPELLIRFILLNIDDYLAEIVEENLHEEEELIELISQEINDTYKIKMLDRVTNVVDIDNENISTQIKKLIIQSNFNKDNLQYLANLYNSDDAELDSIIINKMIEEIVAVIEEAVTIKYDLLIIILESENIVLADKTRLLTNQIKYLAKANFITCLKYLGLEDVKEQPRPKVKKNEENAGMLKEMKRKGYISSYSEDSYDSNSYRIYTSIFNNMKT